MVHHVADDKILSPMSTMLKIGWTTLDKDDMILGQHLDVTLEKRGNEEGVDSTCSESSLSGRAKGMGDRDDLTKGREEWWTTKMVVRAWRREKNLANGMKRDGERDEWFTHGWVETLRIERDASDRGKVTRRREAG
ncbi:hypothetical protein ALC53_04171 [Atta colombica]|uniref:Uncharacterized protein n=1 Tax=Atta colombica TaxID=520822 RepID=A0A195BMG3_9HYME|nr:hypothetical protein ALC53_04171 [Atta colombica]